MLLGSVLSFPGLRTGVSVAFIHLSDIVIAKYYYGAEATVRLIHQASVSETDNERDHDQLPNQSDKFLF